MFQWLWWYGIGIRIDNDSLRSIKHIAKERTLTQNGIYDKDGIIQSVKKRRPIKYINGARTVFIRRIFICLPHILKILTNIK